MSHTVEKIGGTSISDTEMVLENVLLRKTADGGSYGRIIIVSAYAGMTNLLLEHKKSGKQGVFGLFASAQNKWAWSDALSELSEAMRNKNADVFDTAGDREVADAFVMERVEGVRNCLIDLHRLCSYGQFRLDEHLTTVREMLAALGEAHAAHNTALLLRQHGLQTAFVDLTGWRDDRKMSLEQRVDEALKKVDLATTLPIMTGYSGCAEGMVSRFDRGYTEVTFAHIAAATSAAEAIIHKEFHLSSADPNLVGADKVRKIGETNYDVADQLSNMGMEAVHPNAAKILRQADIPLRIKNTFDPADSGTLICSDIARETPRAEIITGLPNVFALDVFEQDMVGVKGYDAAILEALTRHDIRIVSKCSNANTITHYVDASRKALKRAAAEIETTFGSAEVSTRRVSIVSVIGADLDLPGIAAAATGALHDKGIALLGIIQLIRHTDLQMVVSEELYDDAIKVLHEALIERSAAAGRSGLAEAA